MLEEIIESVLDEKTMAPADAAAARKKAKLPAAKKAKKLKARCMGLHGDKIKKSKGKLTCDSKGKVVKGMDKKTKKLMAKARKKSGISGR